MNSIDDHFNSHKQAIHDHYQDHPNNPNYKKALEKLEEQRKSCKAKERV